MPDDNAALYVAGTDIGSRDRTDDDSAWCALCGHSPMPVVVELPDGCVAHPGCANDPVFRDLLKGHATGGTGMRDDIGTERGEFGREFRLAQIGKRETPKQMEARLLRLSEEFRKTRRPEIRREYRELHDEYRKALGL